MSDRRVSRIKLLMSQLQSGKLYHSESYSGELLSGSRPEGLAMDDHWGHDVADTDWMYLYGGTRGIHVPGGQQSRGGSCLDFRPYGCPVAYTKLQITNLPALRERYSWIQKSVHISVDQWCWLNTYQAVRGMRGDAISGPAAKSGTYDFVSTLVCNGQHPDMNQEFAHRPRQWPPAALIPVLLKLPMLLVLVGHKPSSEFHLQARVSWSHLELRVIQELSESIRQGYIAFKYVMKCRLKPRRGQNEADQGRNSVSSYHFKTSFLHYLEKTPPSMITSPFRLFLDLLHELDDYLKVGNLPHYFLPQCNLLETVEEDELCIARQAIQEILSDPLNALLTSPTAPREIYGKVHPFDLLSAFHRVFSHPTCEQSLNYLSELLTRVDERRRQRYRDQRESDEGENNRVSGRAEPTGQVDSLKQI